MTSFEKAIANFDNEQMRVQTIKRLIREYDSVVEQLGDIIEFRPARKLRDMVEQGKKAAIVFKALGISGELSRAFRKELEKVEDPAVEEIPL